MTDRVTTYDPRNVTVRFGPFLLGGFADGSFIKVARKNDSYKMTVGADGEVIRVKTNDRSGEVTVTLQQSSASNDDLSTTMNLDERTNGGVLPFYMKDDSGRTLCEGVSSWIRKPADVERGKDGVNMVWTLDVANLQIFSGGN